MANVGYIRKELAAVLPLYALIKDCLAGSKTIKDARTKYLPMPNAEDTSMENVLRYKSYLERAVFYNVTRRTLSGITGLVFVKNVEYEIPDGLAPIIEDSNGEGVSLFQVSKRAMQYALGFGRSGLFIDYPSVGEASREQIANGEVRPTISLFYPGDIINWRTTTVGAKKYLSLVVIKENSIISDDGFEIKEGTQYRVLRLVNNMESDEINPDVNTLIYKVEIYQKGDGVKRYSMIDEFYPTDANGDHFNEIPFKFIGAENNDSEVDHPPLYDLAELNVSHYRNSADYEESSFMVGQPTPWFSGLTEEWAKDILGNKVALGSRAAVPLPEGGVAGLLQAQANTIPYEAMKHKEEQMIALGAKLVEIKAGNRTTATEAAIDDASETSILVNVSKNVSDAFEWALKWCCRFIGIPEEGIIFKIDNDLEITKMSPDEQRQLVANWQAGAMAFSELRYKFRNAGLTHGEEGAILAEIEKESAERLAQQEKQMAAKTNNVDNKNKSK